MQQFQRLVTVFLAFILVTWAEVAWSDNVPPPDYGAGEFVDGEGCLFARSDLAGWTVWVQRLDAKRNPVCGLEPTRLERGGNESETPETST